MLYPKAQLVEALKLKPLLIKEVWQALKEITPEILLGEGRVYGGGLHKLEPKELGNAPADKIMALLPEAQVELAHESGGVVVEQFEQTGLFS